MEIERYSNSIVAITDQATKDNGLTELAMGAQRTATSVSCLNTAYGVAIHSRHHAAFSSCAAVFE